MSKQSLHNSIIYVLAKGIKIYFSNIDKFFVYMLFPVFGQVIGIGLTFGLTLGFSEKIIQRAHTPVGALLLILLLAIPGLLIFAKAFWDYMVAYVALNSMTEGAVTTGKVYDFQSHNEVATRQTLKYIGFLIILSVFMSVGSSIFFIIPAFVLWIYFVLIFQVFTFEPDLPIFDMYKRSFSLIKGSWGRTFILMIVLAFFSIYILTQGITVIFDYLNLADKLCSVFDIITNRIPLDGVNRTLAFFNKPIITNEMISKSLYLTIITSVISGMTLPIRSICWSLWYKSLSDIKDYDSDGGVKRQRKTSRKKSEDEYME